jgi:hypothetical protein
MSKVRVEFQIGEDENTGTFGLIHDDGMPKVLDGEQYGIWHPPLVAHDVVEHCNGVENIGPVGDEIRALGGVWFVRILTGYGVPTHCSPEQWLSYDVGRMMTLDAGDLNDTGTNVKIDDDDAASFRKVACLAAGHWRDEWYDDDDAPTWTDLLAVARDAYRGLKAGYKACQERYDGDQYKALNLYQAIEREADVIITRYVANDSGEDYNGMPVVLEYDEDTCEARMWADEEWLFDAEVLDDE